MKISRRGRVAPFQVMAILDRVDELRAAGRDVVSLCAGEPSGGAPTDVRELAADLHNSPEQFGYTSPLGTVELRREIARHHERWYDLDVDPSSVAITTGASGAFVVVFLAAFDAGDRVAVVRPGYPAYRNLLQALDIDVVEIPVGPETRFQPTPDLLDAATAEHGDLAGLVLASPANPTGSMVSPDELTAIVTWCSEHDVRLVSDEIYHGITYPSHGPTPTPGESVPPSGESVPSSGGPASQSRGASAWSVDRSAVVVNSFSKYWGMTGWRLGWALLPDELRESVASLAGNVALCPPTTSQRAATAAFTERSYAEADAAVGALATKRDLLFASLDRLGWGPVAPVDGAFYLWAGIGDQLGPHRDSVAWCRALLEEAGVALVPGTDMDPISGDSFVRLSFAASLEAVEEAIERIVAFQRW